MSDAEQNRSEDATPYKLARAREKGSVARGTDLGYLTALTTFAACFWMMGPSLIQQIGQSARRAIVAAPNVLASPNEILAVTGQVLVSVVRPMAFVAAIIFMVVLAFEIIQTGVVFSTETLRPDFGRLNPARGFKRVFSLRMMIETAKNVLKLAVYGAFAYLVIRYAQTQNIASITDAPSLAGFMHRTGLRLLAYFVVGAALFAIVDQLIARRDFLGKMRMSRRELRRELRDREGDPRMKQRRRRLHREFVELSQSLRNIRDADVLIVNPAHLAVALRYDSKTMVAPKVVSRGSHQFALRLRRLAFVYGLVIIENKPLARALYFGCGLNQTVPEDYYRSVADIYLAMREARARKRGS
jgi:flagellar biosynthetic protein FlhB